MLTNCHQATFLLSQGQERPLTRFERLRLRLHLPLCRACVNFGDQVLLLRAAARRFAAGSE